MSNYIFLTNQYLPKPGATGLCVHQLAKELAKENNVWTVCYKDEDDSNVFDEVNIIKIDIPSFLRDNNNKSNIARKIQYCGSLLSKAIFLRYYPLRSRSLIQNYKNAIESILKSVDKATIIASYTPLEAVIAAKEIKDAHKDNVKIVYYSTDTLSNEQGNDGFLSAEYRTKCGIKWEKSLFSVFDKILIMECHKEHYYRDEYQEFFPKYSIVNFPLMVKPSFTSSKKHENGKIRLVYAGTLYRKLRNPEFLLKILVELSSKMKIEAIFLGGGDCKDLLDVAEKRSNSAVRYLGMQPHDIAMNYIASADVLLSIGNIESPMAPSKIYEYMSTGKPILHVYTYDKDPCIEPLMLYGNAICVKDTNENYNERMIDEFINNINMLDTDIVFKNFVKSTPKYTVDILRNV